MTGLNIQTYMLIYISVLDQESASAVIVRSKIKDEKTGGFGFEQLSALSFISTS